MENTTEHIHCFLGESHSAFARVYVEVPRLSSSVNYSTNAKLQGSIRGPFSRRQQTLKANSPLNDKGSGETLLGEAIVTDPCFWTPQSPFLYELNLEIVEQNSVVLSQQINIGLRNIWVENKQLFLQGVPWEIEAVTVSEEAMVSEKATIDFEQVAESKLSLTVTDPTIEFCQQASLWGVPLLIRLSAEDAKLESKLREFQNHASVVLVCLFGSIPENFQTLTTKAFLIGCEYLPEKDRPSWAQFEIVTEEQLSKLSKLSAQRVQDLPMILNCKRENSTSLSNIRTSIQEIHASDSLQKQLPLNQFVGVIIATQ